MTALDNANLSNNSGSNTKNSGSAVGGVQRSMGSGRLSLRGQKRALSSDISPAPEPRTSHRIRTNSSGENALDTNKAPSASNVRAKNSSTVPSSSPAYRATQLGLRRPTSSASNSSSSPNTSGDGGGGGGNGGGGGGGSVGVAGGRVPGVCPLANLGNTCFLNSVLYALRFLPGFTHDLHHLHTHLQAARCEGDESVQQRVQFLSELHAVFVQLGREERSATEARRLPALQPYLFLQALRVVNPMFEGNRQQDAHELLHCLLDQLCHLPQDLVKRGAATATSGSSKAQPVAVPARDTSLSPPHKRARRRSERIQAQEEDHSKAVDVVGSKFVGRMCLETCCSECEKVTGREETFLEVCVPVKTKADFDDEEPPSECEVFMSALCEEECLQGNNKYWCDACSHHNEARRSVHYPQLPHHLLIHVKRFSAYSRNMYTSKCSDAMPAPLQLSCFCRSCLGVQLLEQQRNADSCEGTARASANDSNDHSGAHSNANRRGKGSSKNNKNNTQNNSNNSNCNNSPDSGPHLPYHLSAMVCHLGASLSSGHYMTYVRVSPHLSSSCPEQHLPPHSSSTLQPPGLAGEPIDPTPFTQHSSGGSAFSALPGVPPPLATSSPAGGSGGASSANGVPCSWLECCALRLDQVLPQVAEASLTNGYASDMDTKSSNSKSGSKSSNSDNKSRLGGRNHGKQSHKHNGVSSSASSNGLWLECDDEKIKLVAANEVVERMRGTLITPYLLFYSRLGTTASPTSSS